MQIRLLTSKYDHAGNIYYFVHVFEIEVKFYMACYQLAMNLGFFGFFYIHKWIHL